MPTTSSKFRFNSSNDAPCVCAPENPGTYPTYSPVSGHFSTTAVNDFIARPYAVRVRESKPTNDR